MWVRLDDGMAHHPKFVRSGPEALAFFVAGLCYCNRYQTEGLIPKLVLPSLLPGLSQHRAMELAMRLATNALRPSWIDVGEHFRVHDYEVYQPTRKDARDETERAQDWAREPESWDGVTRDVAGYGARDGEAFEDQVTRYGNAPERYRNAPLPGPLPPPRPVPVMRAVSTSSGWDGDREQARRAQNRERQRRFRERHAARRSSVTSDVIRDVTRDVTHYVTRYGNAVVVEPDACPCPVGTRGVLSAAVSREERERVRRAQNAERQRRFRSRQAARRAEAARNLIQDRDEAGRAPMTPEGNGAARRDDAAVQEPLVPARCERHWARKNLLPAAPACPEPDRGAEFVVWFAAYPRREAEIPACRAWMAEPELPPLALLLERLAAQKAARPDAYFWLAPDRYLREKRWRDQPPTAPARAVQVRSVWAQLRAMGSDEGRRQRLREISAEARFDPFDPGVSRG
jgi:hypothetical protein